jgi:hypothetical protein
MAAGQWQLTNEGRTRLSNGEWLDGDTYKIALFLSTSNIGAASTTYAGLTNEHANANGYTTGGNAVTVSRSGTTTVTIDLTDPAAWTASGGSITARFAVLYEVSGRVLAYCLLDSTPADVTATDGNTLTITIHASGILTLA